MAVELKSKSFNHRMNVPVLLSSVISEVDQLSVTLQCHFLFISSVHVNTGNRPEDRITD